MGPESDDVSHFLHDLFGTTYPISLLHTAAKIILFQIIKSDHVNSA